MSNFLKKFFENKKETDNKRKIENIFFLIILLIVTLIVINKIWNNDSWVEDKENDDKILALNINEEDNSGDKVDELEKILSTIKGVGKVRVYISYAETSTFVPIYNEIVTTNDSEEVDNNRWNA